MSIALAAGCTDDSTPLNVVPLEPTASEAVSGGTAQSVTVNTVVGEVPTVVIADRFGNGVPGVEVRFDVVAGGGSATPAVDTTDNQGRATTQWRLGTVAGANALRATPAGLDPIDFAATGLPGPPALVVAISGNGQTATVAQELTDTLVAESRDDYGNPTQGAAVVWAPNDTSARVTALSAETDENGRARAIWTLGTKSGTKTVQIRAGSLGLGSMSATARADVPATLEKVGGDDQTAPAGAALAQKLVARIGDQYGNGVPDVPVVWTVTSGSGSFEPDTAITDDSGLASARYVAGRTPLATEQVSASFGGLAPVDFTAHTDNPDNLYIDGLYLTQGAQNYHGTVPLVAGRDAYLRVFVVAGATNAHRTRVAVSFYQDGVLFRTDTLERDSDATPNQPDESDLTASWNLPVPGSLIHAGLSILAVADPDDDVYESDEGDNAFPSNGTPGALDVRALPDFRARLVPIQVFGPGGSSIGNVSEANKGAWLAPTFAMFPMAAYDADVREVFTSSVGDLRDPEHWSTILGEMSALRADEGSSRYYYGVIGFLSGAAYCGLGYIGFPAAIGIDQNCGPATAAHEWGHNFGRRHAPCGNPAGPDPSYPYGNASIGVYGLDVPRLALKSPFLFADLMSYCDPAWISDYTYQGVLEYRDNEGSVPPVAVPRQRALIVWGRIEADRLVLEPAFESTTSPSLPAAPGPYRLEGVDRAGASVFSLSFAGAPVDHLDGRVRHFAFAIPFDQARPADLDRIRLSAPGTSMAPAEVSRPRQPVEVLAAVRTTPVGPDRLRLEWNADAVPLVVVRSAQTGRILSLARGASAIVAADGAEVDVTLAPGIGGIERRMRVR